MRALHTAATGMMAQELNVQVISNNIANMRTTGYKRQRAEFQDLLYEHVRRIGTQTSDQGNILPVGVELGSGVKTAGTPRVMTQGTLLPTGKDFDVAIRGEGFFKIALPDGRTAYTRDGSFELDAQGRIVTAQGNVVQPGITIPPNAGGLMINAQEVEYVLSLHDSVVEAAVVGIPTGAHDEEVVAFVVVRGPAASPSILRHCRQNLAGYKVPQRVVVVDAMPRNTSGKVVKADLRKLAAVKG